MSIFRSRLEAVGEPELAAPEAGEQAGWDPEPVAQDRWADDGGVGLPTLEDQGADLGMAQIGDEPPDIPEVPFSVRVASLWGSAPAAPSGALALGATGFTGSSGLLGEATHEHPALDDDGVDELAPPSRAPARVGGPEVLDEAQAWQRLLRLMERYPGRIVLGLAGSPGAGKTTYAEYLAACCVDAAVIGLDGFGLSSGALTRMGRGARRGAPDTFDLEGYLALLRRLRRDDQHTVWAPEYRRDLEEPVAAAVPVRPSTRVVVTEGNYLLLPQREWIEARSLCHEVWFVEVPERARVERLVGRHRHYGRSKAQARARVTVGVDAENAHVVAATRDRADVVVRLSLSEGEYF